VAASAASLHADPDVARAALESGRNALTRKDWPAAVLSFQRALEEEPTLVEARMGLAEAHAGAGRRPEAAQALRDALERLEAVGTLPADQLALYTRARKRLAELSSEDAALDVLVRKHADALVALGTKWAAKDAAAAGDAIRAALRLAPDHPKAGAALAKAGEAASRAPVALFNGRDTSGWTGAGSQWRVEAGALVGDVPDGAYALTSQERYKGDFDVLVEASELEVYPRSGPTFFALKAPWTDDRHWSSLGCLRGALVWRDAWGSSEAEQRDVLDVPYAKVRAGITPRTWLTYELRFRGGQMFALIDGKEVARAPRRDDRAEGHVVLVVQNCKVAFRRIEITQR
jgi:tetratricopeptide (TPR) repeat protein